MKKQLLLNLLLILLLGYCLNTKAQISSNSTGGGSWNIGSSWTGGIVPTSSDDVVIQASDIITLSSTQNCDDLTINSSGTLTLQTNSLLTLTRHLTINGTLTVEDGTLNAGDAKSDKLDISAGTLNFSGGIINVAGRYSQTSGANAYLSGSAILNISTAGNQTGTAKSFSVTTSGTFSVSNGSTAQVVLKYGNTGSTIEMYYSPGTSSFDGGSIVIENTSSLSDIYIDSDKAIYNIEIKSRIRKCLPFSLKL